MEFPRTVVRSNNQIRPSLLMLSVVVGNGKILDRGRQFVGRRENEYEE